jgi:hypothetical protein
MRSVPPTKSCLTWRCCSLNCSSILLRISKGISWPAGSPIERFSISKAPGCASISLNDTVGGSGVSVGSIAAAAAAAASLGTQIRFSFLRFFLVPETTCYRSVLLNLRGILAIKNVDKSIRSDSSHLCRQILDLSTTHATPFVFLSPD